MVRLMQQLRLACSGHEGRDAALVVVGEEMPKRGDSTPETARAAAPRSTASCPPRVTVSGAASVRSRRSATEWAQRLRRARRDGSAAHRAQAADQDRLGVEQILDGDDGSAQQRRHLGDPAVDDGRASGDRPLDISARVVERSRRSSASSER